MGRILAVLFTVILLFGCGGEDKSSNPPASMPEIGATEGVVLNERAALSISNSYLRVQAAPGLPPAKLTLETDCDGPTCTLTESRTGISESVSLQDIETTDTDSIENLRQVAHSILTRNGIAVYGGSVSFALGEDSSRQRHGIWRLDGPQLFPRGLGKLFRSKHPLGTDRHGAFHRQRYWNSSRRGCHL